MTQIRRHYIVLLGLVLLIILLRWPFLEQPFDNDSAANAYHARLILRGEPLYSTHHPAHHLPAVYYVYALAFWLWGDNLWSVKFLLIGWTIVTAYLLYQLAQTLMKSSTSLIATLFYIILTAHLYLFGSSAEIELFANLPRIATLFVFIHLQQYHKASWQYIAVGLLGIISFLFKVIYITELVLIGAIFLWQLWITPHRWRVIIEQSGWIILGFGSGGGLVLAYFVSLGLMSRLLLIFTLGSNTYLQTINVTPIVGEQTWLLYILFPLLGLAFNNVMILAWCLAGSLLVIIKPKYRQSNLLYLVIWLGLSLLIAGINRRFFYHYYLLIVPPLSLLAAWFIFQCYDDIRKINKKASFIFLISILTLTFAPSIIQNGNYYYRYGQYKIGQISYPAFLIEGWPEEGPRLVELQKLADYIDQHTMPSDKIFYWSYYVQLYYLADRKAPLESFWPEYVELFGGKQAIFDPTTRYIVIDTQINIPTPDWIYQGLAEHYLLEATINDQEIYRRVE